MSRPPVKLQCDLESLASTILSGTPFSFGLSVIHIKPEGNKEIEHLINYIILSETLTTSSGFKTPLESFRLMINLLMRAAALLNQNVRHKRDNFCNQKNNSCSVTLQNVTLNVGHVNI